MFLATMAFCAGLCARIRERYCNEPRQADGDARIEGPGHGSFCKWLTGNLENTTNAYYVPWEKRKAEVLKKGIRGMPMGYGQSYYYSFIKEPLTLDFSKEP